MIRMSHALCLSAIVVGAASDALAAPHYHTGPALPIYRRTFGLVAGSHQFRTANLQSLIFGSTRCLLPNTFMVVTSATGQEIANDDCVSGAAYSCVSITAGATGAYTVTVFASPAPAGFPNRCGRTDIYVDDVLRDAGVNFGGSVVTLTWGTLPAGTVHPPDGALDTVLLAYDANWQQLGYDDNSGTGLAARISLVTMTSGGTLRFAFGSYAQSGSGRAALVLNRCRQRPDDTPNNACKAAALDDDGDNLSNGLELELQTNRYFHDTDADGIFDYFEVYGRRLPGGTPHSIEFVQFGANPRRRDVFLEVDRERIDINNPNNPNSPSPAEGDGRCPAPSLGSPLRERLPFDLVGDHSFGDVVADRATYTRDVFLDTPTLPANPDGTRFIQVHIDGGAPCPGFSTLCGNWGGSDLLQKPLDYYANLAQVAENFSPLRQGLFKYVWYTCGGVGTAFEGPTARGEQADIVTHELGHTYGLQHWGKPPPGHHELNWSTYPSTMNYNYSYRFPQWSSSLAARSRFSEGQLRSLDSPLSELAFLDGIFAPHFDDAPFSFTIVAAHVDFNRDGRYSGSILADTSPLDRAYTGYWPDFLRAYGTDGDIPSAAPHCLPGGDGLCHPSGGPAIASRPLDGSGAGAGRISKVYAYVPFIHETTLQVYPDVSTHVENTDAPDQVWTTFAPGVPLNGHRHGEATARVVTTVPRLLLLFPAWNGVLYYRYFNPESAVATAWQPIPNWPVGVQARNASIGDGTASSGGLVPVVWTNALDPLGRSGPNVWEAWFDPIGLTWRTPARTNVTSIYTPGVSAGPDGRYYLAVALETPRVIDIYRYTTTAVWSPILSGLQENDRLQSGIVLPPSPPGPQFEDVGRLNLLFVPLRTGDGQAFADGSGQLAVFWATFASQSPSEWRLRRAYQQGYMTATQFIFTKWAPRRVEGIDRPAYRHSVSAVRRWYDVSVLQTGSTFASGTTRHAMFIPNATGTVIGFRGHIDTNDVQVISDALCHSAWRMVKGAHAACYCNTMADCPGFSGLLPPPNPPTDNCPAPR
jgi:hypothetical protein